LKIVSAKNHILQANPITDFDFQKLEPISTGHIFPDSLCYLESIEEHKSQGQATSAASIVTYECFSLNIAALA